MGLLPYIWKLEMETAVFIIAGLTAILLWILLSTICASLIFTNEKRGFTFF